jgi:sialic acid synthase SpsE/mannose-6-phosphate isomerase-like protein (cupin superfamily)
MSEYFDKLFVFEMANNHMGDVEHGLRIMRELRAVSKDFDFRFAFKLQFRDLDTFIHPAYRGRQDIKYVKRFEETRLGADAFKRLRGEMDALGFLSICTPFDEKSVDLIEELDFAVIKIGSCSFTDWPLLERVAKTSKPIIASTAGATLDAIDRVESFLEHRKKDFALMSCVGEYPTRDENLQLNQIDVLKRRYPGIPVGYSTHESPDNDQAIRIAIAKGAVIFEKHVGLKTDRYDLNAYSAGPEHVRRWLAAAKQAFAMCGASGERYAITEKERNDLRGLQRGVFAAKPIAAKERVAADNILLAIPNVPGQAVANDLSKYASFVARKDIREGEPLMLADVVVEDSRARVLEIVRKLRTLCVAGNIALPNRVELELSHHYGIDRYEEWGAAIINCINREYCKKLILMLPGQKHPVHAHVKKEESFQVLYGDISLDLAGQKKELKPGDMVVVERGTKHSFHSANGGIFEEISTTHHKNDSFYEDPVIRANTTRKTEMTLWSDWLCKPIS